MKRLSGKAVLVAHPGRQHSVRLAEALKEAGLLDVYATTVFYGSGRSLTNLVTRILPVKDRRRARGRSSQVLEDDDIVQLWEGLGLVQLLAMRLAPGTSAYYLLSRLVSRLFQWRVARLAIRNEVDAVVAYDTQAAGCFEVLQRNSPNIVRILDHSHVVRNVAASHVLASAGVLEVSKAKGLPSFVRDSGAAERAVIECGLADYHLVASSYAAEALSQNGVSTDRIFIVPYGVDQAFFGGAAGTVRDPSKFLFVGQLSRQKGVHIALEAFSRLPSGSSLTLVGAAIPGESALYDEYDERVEFVGRQAPSELVAEYASSSVFVFPSLCDGFGQVVLEALSAGLPVICSRNCVGGDVIVDYVNGFVVDAGDVDSLAERMRWCQEHPEQVDKMRDKARQSAAEFPWDRYERRVQSAVTTILESKHAE